MSQRPLSSILAVAVTLFLLTACGGGGQEGQPTEPDEPEQQVASVKVTPTSAELNALDATQDFDAIAKDQNGNTISGVSFSWSVDPDSLGSIDGEGTVTAEANGAGTVAAAADGVSGSASLVVDQEAVTVTVDPDSFVFIEEGEEKDFDAEVLDSNENEVRSAELEWSSSKTAVAEVDGQGVATAVDEGSAAIVARAGGLADSASVEVEFGVASVTVDPDSLSLLVEDSVEVTAEAKDARGNTLAESFDWESESQSIATVTPIGTRAAAVEGVGVGSTSVTATADGVSGSASVVVREPEEAILARITAGEQFTCGIDEEDQLLCWGYATQGTLGQGADEEHENKLIATPVETDIAASKVASGRKHSCSITTSNEVYCWGDNDVGQVGDGSDADRLTPSKVATDKSFSVITAGFSYSCGVTTSGAGYCWGGNVSGRLGDGTEEHRSEPVEVKGGLTFKGIDAGAWHTCGVTNDGVGYCWGSGSYGRLGTGFHEDEDIPAKVAGGLEFTTISAGRDFTCGLNTVGKLYCWGRNVEGQLGNGESTEDTGEGEDEPVEVATSERFIDISAGYYTACAVSEDGTPYCWGLNDDGMLGRESTDETCDSDPFSTTPVVVSSSISLETITVGRGHVCGRADNGAAYCWGTNGRGQLGDNTQDSSANPVRIVRRP